MNTSDLTALLQSAESVDLEYKRTFPPGYFENTSAHYDNARAEVIKDVAALANAQSPRPGYLIYGIADDNGVRSVHHQRRTHAVDDAKLREFFRRFIEPAPHFAYSEFEYQAQLVGLLRVDRVMPYPHVIRERVNKSAIVAPGQVWLRKGTQNTVALSDDLQAIYRGYEPYRIEAEGEECKALAAQARERGFETIWVTASHVEMRERDGAQLIYQPGTRRRVARASHFAESEPSYMMQRPPRHR